MVNTRKKVCQTTDSSLLNQPEVTELSGESDNGSTQRRSTRRASMGTNVASAITSKDLPLTPVRRSRRLSNSSIESGTNDSPIPIASLTRRSLRSKVAAGSDNEDSDVKSGSKKRKVAEAVETLTVIDEEKADQEIQVIKISDPIEIIDLESEEATHSPVQASSKPDVTEKSGENEMVDITSDDNTNPDKQEILVTTETVSPDSKTEQIASESSTLGNKATEELTTAEENKVTEELTNAEESKDALLMTEEKSEEATEKTKELTNAEENKVTKELTNAEEIKDAPLTTEEKSEEATEKTESSIIAATGDNTAGQNASETESAMVETTTLPAQNEADTKENVSDETSEPVKSVKDPKITLEEIIRNNPLNPEIKRQPIKKITKTLKRKAEGVPAEAPKEPLPCGAEIMKSIPRGKPKSGRLWKDPKSNPRYMFKDKGLKMPFEKITQLREERKRVKMLEDRMKEEERIRRAELNRRREINKQRQEENTKKGEIVQVIRNTAKLKRMSKKQLRSIQKRDTTLAA